MSESWVNRTKYRHYALSEMPKLNVHKKRWSINNPLFRRQLREHYLKQYVNNFTKLDKRVYYAYGMYHGVEIQCADDMYRELYDRFYCINRMLDPCPKAPTYCDTLTVFATNPQMKDLYKQRVLAHALHDEVHAVVKRARPDEWEHMWRPLRSVNAELRNLYNKAGDCTEEDLDDHVCAIESELLQLKRDLNELQNGRPFFYYQYCPCKACVKGLWHLRSKVVCDW